MVRLPLGQPAFDRPRVSVTPALPPRVVVYGGHGFYGGLLLDEILSTTKADIVIAGRQGRSLERVTVRRGARVTAKISDLTNPDSVNRAIAGASVVVCCAGPFETLPLTLVRACLQHGTPYVDITNHRTFYHQVKRLASDGPTPTAPILSGYGLLPGLSCLLVKHVSQTLKPLNTVRIAVAPGNRHLRARSALASLLASVGQPLHLQRQGRIETVTSWTEPELVTFPPPVGPRTTYLVDAPEYEVLPEAFGVQTVSVRLGAELHVLNRVLERQAARVSHPESARRSFYPVPLHVATTLAGWLGTSAGALHVTATGTQEGTPRQLTVTLVMPADSERLAVLPAALAVQHLLRGGPVPTGFVRADQWLSLEEVLAETQRRGATLVTASGPA